MPGQLDRISRVVRAHMKNHLFAFRRTAHRRLSDLFSLCNGLQKSFARAAANIDAMNSLAVEALQQALEGCDIKSLAVVKRSHNGGKDSMK
jgi:hypothetical protein